MLVTTCSLGSDREVPGLLHPYHFWLHVSCFESAYSFSVSFCVDIFLSGEFAIPWECVLGSVVVLEKRSLAVPSSTHYFATLLFGLPLAVFY